MDVRCPRCHVEYEFDDDKVTTAGVAVQCTGCNHVFRVAKQAPAAPTSAPEKEEWMVRQSDGRVIRFKELTTLQKWIVEQKVARTDEISRSGRTWRPLGDIAELSSFFQVVEAARAAQSMAAHGIVSAPVMPPPHAMLPALEPAQHTIQNMGLPPLAVHEPVRTNATPTTTPAIQTASTETFFGEERSLDALDDDDPVKKWRDRQRFRRAALFVGIVVVSAGAAAVAVRPDLLAQVRTMLTGPSAEQSALVARVERALIDDNALEIETVDKILETALKSDVTETALHALRARTLVARARALRLLSFTVADVGARQERERDVRALLDTAEVHVLLALRDAEVTSSARLANADLQAARGALLEMESDLELALAADAQPSTVREASAVRALGHVAALVGPPAEGLADAAKVRVVTDLIAKAQTLSPDDTRLLFAALVVQTARVPAAATPDAVSTRDETSRALEAALAAHPSHLGLRALKDHVAGVVSGTAAVAAPEAPAAPIAAAALPPTTTEPARDPNEQPPPTTEAKPEPAAAKESDASIGFDALMNKADRLRRSDRSRQALGLYQKAAQLRPSDPRPHVGIGWANLDVERTSSAIGAFKKALALDSEMAEAHLGLGEAHRGRDDKAAAITAFKAYLRLAPAGEEAGVAKRAIQQLEAAP
jgi:predicted Zn finger-like uncharacterized protein